MDERTRRIGVLAMAAASLSILEAPQVVVWDEGTRGALYPSRPNNQNIRFETTSRSETPLPSGLSPWFAEVGTGSLTIAEPASELVRVGSRHMMRLAFLPINEDDERIVNKLFADLARPTARQALARKQGVRGGPD